MLPIRGSVKVGQLDGAASKPEILCDCRCALAVVLAYLCFAFIITIPFGVMIINRIPYLMALRQPPMVIMPWGEVKARQHNSLLRALWFLLIALWVTAIWMTVAYLLCLTIIGMPIGFWMFDRAPAILTLHKSA